MYRTTCATGIRGSGWAASASDCRLALGTATPSFLTATGPRELPAALSFPPSRKVAGHTNPTRQRGRGYPSLALRVRIAHTNPTRQRGRDFSSLARRVGVDHHSHQLDRPVSR